MEALVNSGRGSMTNSTDGQEWVSMIEMHSELSMNQIPTCIVGQAAHEGCNFALSAFQEVKANVII